MPLGGSLARANSLANTFDALAQSDVIELAANTARHFAARRWDPSDCSRVPQQFDPSAFVGRTVKQMDDALKGHRGEATAEVTVEGESVPSAELVRLAGLVPAACVLYATTTRSQDTTARSQETPELQWQLASYADVELLMAEAPTLTLTLTLTLTSLASL